MILENLRKQYPVAAPAILILICALSLTPFLDKAFNIDDPLFIWVAKQIHAHPFDFYGFTANWNGYEKPMWKIAQNPPLASYYLAAAAYGFGWREVALHLAFFVPAIAAVLGTYFLAGKLCQRPMAAALVTLSTPVFLISSTAVMCDTLMLSLWVWAIFFWLRGIQTDRSASLVVAAFLIAACSLTKYFGMSLIPLLFVYSWAEKRRLGRWTFFLLIPVTILVAYQWGTYEYYGKGLLLNAAAYATSYRAVFGSGFLARTLTGLAFAGGCLISILFFSPFLWRRRTLAVGAFFTLIFLLVLPLLEQVGTFRMSTREGVNWLFIIQFSLLTFGGVSFVALGVGDLWKRRNAASLLLFLWSMGTLIFAGFLNWSVNARSVLPLVPVFGILLMRHFEDVDVSRSLNSSWRIVLPLLSAFLFAFWTAWADYKLADSVRSAAADTQQKFLNTPGSVWFEGHWGFQYYMERSGGKAINFRSSALRIGDIIIIPANNTDIKEPRPEDVERIGVLQFPVNRFLTILNKNTGAGFYSDAFGPLPFVIGPDAVEEYHVYRVIR